MTIHLSFDQDWAPTWATRQLHDRLVDAGVAGTLFVTQACGSLDDIRSAGLVELGVHPNFLPGSTHGSSEAEVLDHVRELVPDATGVRAHALVQSTPLLHAYGDRGFVYESADLMDGLTGLRPIRMWNGMTRIPIFWEDDVHLMHNRTVDLGAVDLESDGLKVFNFHPILLALNCADLDGYRALKQHLGAAGRTLVDATEDEVAPFVETDRAGLRDVFDALVDHLVAHPALQGGTLASLVV